MSRERDRERETRKIAGKRENEPRFRINDFRLDRPRLSKTGQRAGNG